VGIYLHPWPLQLHNLSVLCRSDPDMDISNSMIAKQMMKLSPEDREKVYMDVHRVRKGPSSETKEAILEGLESMQRDIDRLQGNRAV